ncbi:MAG TPA: alpha/beta hydrolase [Bryobacteraceae bacterium]|nr:alpha/beta hydrolase [Bryobacteraceae bacterium]
MATLFDPGLNVIDQMNRRALPAAGLVEHVAESPAGPQTYFAGGSGRDLWLLHGAGDHAGAWSRIVPPLMAAGRYRLVIPDLAGHGASAPFGGPLQMESLLSAIDAVAAGCGSARAIFAGNSFGAWLAFLQVARDPARVERVIAINGGPITGIRPDLSLTPADRAEARRTWEALVDRSHWAVPDMILDEVIRKGREGALSRLCIANMRDYLLDGRIGEIQTPVDLIWGESDALVPLDYARGLAAGLPNSRLTTVAACGHVPQMECPERFASVLLGVLAAPPPEGREP